MGNTKKDKSQSLGHIIKNNWFLFKIAVKVTPALILLPVLRSIIFSIFSFLTGAYMLRYVINGFQDGKPFSEMIVPVICVCGAYFLCSLLSSAYDAFLEPVQQLKLSEHLKKMIFAKNESVELGCYEDKEFYDKYVKAANNIENRLWDVVNTVYNCLWMIMSFSLNAFLIIAIDPWLLVFTVIPVIAKFTLGEKRNKIQHEYDMKRQEEERQRDYTRRTFYLNDFAKEMRLTNIYKVMFARFNKSVKNIIAYIKEYGFKLGAIDYITNELYEVGAIMGAQLYAIYGTLVSGTIKYGDCLVIITAISEVSNTFMYGAQNFMEFHENSLYIDTIREYLEYEPKIKDGEFPAPKSGDIKLENVCFRYVGQDADVLKNINISIINGEKIALVGHNGAGKSTLVKLLMRLYDPTAGTISFADRDIRDYKLTGEEGYRERFGTVFQDFRLFSMSVADNVLLRRHRDGDEAVVEQALKDSGVYDKVMTFENGMDTVLTREFDDKGEVLSGGEGQKVAISRVFVKENSVVILDEPSSALDPIAEYKMYENMMKACENRSVIFISHRLSSAVLADRIYLLENGEIIEEGTHHELMQKAGKYAEIFTLQAKYYVADGEEVRA